MEFDIRNKDYIFKHSRSECPDLSEERYKEHYHTELEILYFVSGDAQYMLNHTLYNIKPGSLLIAKPGEYHNIVFKSAQPYERYVIRFNLSAIHPSIVNLLQKAKSVYYIANSPAAEEFYHMDAYIPSLHPDMQLYACIGSLHILTACLASSDELIQTADYVDLECMKIVNYIDQNLAEIQSIEDLVSALHMSKSTIYNIIRNQLHVPVMTYIRTQKCIAAKALIEQGFKASEVSERMGFQHYSSFYRDYRKIFRESPGKK